MLTGAGWLLVVYLGLAAGGLLLWVAFLAAMTSRPSRRYRRR